MGLAEKLRELADEAEVMEARLMPEGMSWPMVDGKPLDFRTHYEPSLGVLEAVSIYSAGACEVMSHDGIIKGISEIHIAKPKVVNADGVEIRVGDTVWHAKTGSEYRVLSLSGVDKAAWVTEATTMGDDFFIDIAALTHERPESWERIEADCMQDAKDYCEERGIAPEYPIHNGKAKCRDLVRRAKALAGVSER